MSHPVFHGKELRQYDTRKSFCRAMTWHRSLSSELVDKLWNSTDDVLAVGQPLQDKERCLVVRLMDGPDSLVFKHHNWGGPWKTFCKSLRTPQARQSFLDGIYLTESGVCTPKPVALVERKLGPFGRHSYLLTEHVTGTSLYRLMRFECPPHDLVEYVIDQVTELCSQLSDLRVSHNDLKPENLMIDSAGRVWLIDLEKMRHHETIEPVQVRLLEDLNRLLHPRNWRENRDAGERFRQRFLQHSTVTAALAQVQPKKHPLLGEQSFDRGQDNKLSVLVVSPRGVHNLQACIDSFRDVADQIIVADGRPTEDTRKLLSRLDCQWVERDENPSESSADFRNRALAKAHHPWVLIVEGDERVSPDLAKEIQCLLTDEPQANAYRISRRRVYLGHVSKFGVFRGEAPVRLFRREQGSFVAHRMRTRLQTQTKSIGRMKSKLVYYFCWKVTDLVRSANESTTHVARLRYEKGRRPSWLGALFRAGRRFAKNYFLRFACLDGRVGLQMSLLSAFTVLLVEAKLWELHHAKLQHAPQRRTNVPGLRLFSADLDAANREQITDSQIKTAC